MLIHQIDRVDFSMQVYGCDAKVPYPGTRCSRFRLVTAERDPCWRRTRLRCAGDGRGTGSYAQSRQRRGNGIDMGFEYANACQFGTLLLSDLRHCVEQISPCGEHRKLAL